MTSVLATLALSACGTGGDGDKGKAETPQATVAAVEDAIQQDAEAITTPPPAPLASTVQADAVRAGEIDRSHAGTPAPNVPFMQRNGVSRRISDFTGRPVLVNLWATWCAPCIAEMPALDRLSLAVEGLAVLPVSQDLGGWQAVDKFFVPDKFRSIVPYLDQPNALALAYKAQGLPMSILYDARGKEVWRVNGPLEWDDPAIAAMIKRAAS